MGIKRTKRRKRGRGKKKENEEKRGKTWKTAKQLFSLDKKRDRVPNVLEDTQKQQVARTLEVQGHVYV